MLLAPELGVSAGILGRGRASVKPRRTLRASPGQASAGILTGGIIERYAASERAGALRSSRESGQVVPKAAPSNRADAQEQKKEDLCVTKPGRVCINSGELTGLGRSCR